MSDHERRQYWARLVDEHAAALVSLGRGQGLAEHDAQSLTGRVLAAYAQAIRHSAAGPDIAGSLRSLMLCEIDRVNPPLQPRARPVRVNLSAVTRVLRLVPSAGSVASPKNR